MLKNSLHFNVKNIALRQLRTLFNAPKITAISGKSSVQQDNSDVKLRGIKITGRSEDLPNMIFFPQMCDQPENWINFFTSNDNEILNLRNVYILNPRNFGTSDKHKSWYTEDMANDVLRFMYEHKISTATIGGHGLGAKVALASACYHSSYFTGFFG